MPGLPPLREPEGKEELIRNWRRLRSVPVFAGLDKKELRRVAECALEIDVKPGDKLVREGRHAFEVLVIERGAAEVWREGEHIADLGEGDIFGETAALTHGQRNAMVVAASKGRVIYIRAQDFRRLVNDLPQLRERIQDIVDARTQAG